MSTKSQQAGYGHHRRATAPTEAPPPPPPSHKTSKLSAARAAVHEFLASELDAREVRLTKIAPIGPGGAGWRAEAEILVPNLEVKKLGLPLTQEVLEREHYSVELDEDLIVTSFQNANEEEE
ncbi:hypothetical protein [Methylocystis bryophila]|uniref:Uncharacterized protein n=1 Tax=Methylocystis bryophila TaxID=655015 RepID=A0A1W6MXW7_9HYPH|nr:hypothetical protein [Methylocystis bryophila]ARN82432.1 hypothetical protein B1812_16595 [Methylocystis bryophila]BDV38615.1 hypothetical protein DSM21852_18680 [Methylocystis bryophila]